VPFADWRRAAAPRPTCLPSPRMLDCKT
jgi:hypothetical protein